MTTPAKDDPCPRCEHFKDLILHWRREAFDACCGKYGNSPQGEPLDYWRGRRAVLYELSALHEAELLASLHPERKDEK